MIGIYSMSNLPSWYDISYSQMSLWTVSTVCLASHLGMISPTVRWVYEQYLHFVKPTILVWYLLQSDQFMNSIYSMSSKPSWYDISYSQISLWTVSTVCLASHLGMISPTVRRVYEQYLQYVKPTILVWYLLQSDKFMNSIYSLSSQPSWYDISYSQMTLWTVSTVCQASHLGMISSTVRWV